MITDVRPSGSRISPSMQTFLINLLIVLLSAMLSFLVDYLKGVGSPENLALLSGGFASAGVFIKRGLGFV